jgi:hypothetical protein
MPAKININKELEKAFNANSNAKTCMGLYAVHSLLNVVPQGCYPKLIESKLNDDGHLHIDLTYSLINIPARGTWEFSFMFINSHEGIVSVRRISGAIHVGSCTFNQDELDKVVKTLAEE